MTAKAWLTCLVVIGIGFGAVLNAYAKEPVFVRWLIADDPGDETIRTYWERYDRGELEATEMVDLGTMLFYRGYPKDAVRLFEAALDENKELEEAWFRIGLVEHQQGNHRQARMAYKKCLKLFKGHGWCNFYLALLEEQEGNAKTAMAFYRRAFRYAPVLADPKVNPEVTSSDLSLGAWLRMAHEESFRRALPMPYLNSEQIEKERASHDLEKDAEEKLPKAKKKTKESAIENAEVQTAPKPPGDGSAALTPATAGEEKKAKPTKKKISSDRGRPSATKKPQPTPTPVGFDDQPFGLPGTDSVSPEGRV